MSKRWRRRARTAPRRQPAAAARRLPVHWLVVGAGATLAIVAVGIAVLLANQPPANQAVPGIKTGEPPWPPEVAQLRERLTADGLQVLSAEGEALHIHQHFDLYLDGRQVAIPIDIGINRSGRFLAPIHTHDASGIIHVESPIVRDFTLGEFFDVWGVRLDGHCVGGACDGNGRMLSVFVNGQSYTGDPRSLVLAAHQEIVVAVGTADQLPRPIPSSYVFPTGL